jgi:hypothetical protein
MTLYITVRERRTFSMVDSCSIIGQGIADEPLGTAPHAATAWERYGLRDVEPKLRVYKPL